MLASHFLLNSCVNKQNFRYWIETNPQQVLERPLHNARVTVWCAIAEFGVVGPYFFEEGEITVTVTSDRYIEMLENFLRPQEWKEWMWRMPGFNRMEQRLIRRGDPCKFCGKCFRGSWSPWAAMSGGQHIRLISLPAISYCGTFSNQRCTHTDLETFKPSRTLFAGKSPLFPLQWPNESCEHSEIVSRSISLMMATTLEISFLKNGDKNYFIYPLLCYNEIFGIFYSFYRINVWNVVLLFDSLCIYVHTLCVCVCVYILYIYIYISTKHTL